MRVLILSCSTGGGHNSCAAAIAEVFKKCGHFCETKDSLSFVSESFARVISKGHSLIYRRFPRLFEFGYDFAEKHPSFLKKGSAAYKLITKGAEKLYSCIAEGGYDAVVCVHIFSGMILREALNGRPKLNIKTAFVATDYTCSPGVEIFDYDTFFIPDSSLMAEFLNHGIPEEKISAVGIPVMRYFCRSTGKAEAKLAFGIVPEHKHLLIMCGSMGCGPIEKILRSFSEKLPKDIEITVVCGNNEKLYKKLYQKYKSYKNIHIMGYTKDIPLLMESADLYLTKPGGLSTSEAFSKALPMALIDAVAGCEKHNMKYFLELGGAVTADSPEALAEKCLSLLRNDKELRRMSEALSENRKPSAAGEIYFNMGGKKCDTEPLPLITEISASAS